MFAFLIIASILAIVSSKRYQAHDKVLAVANTVGPFNNPTETYPVRNFMNNLYDFLYIILNFLACSFIRFPFALVPENKRDINKISVKRCLGHEKLPPLMRSLSWILCHGDLCAKTILMPLMYVIYSCSNYSFRV